MTRRTNVYRQTPEERLSETVIRAVADTRGVDPAGMDPRLFDVIDPCALDRLFPESRDGSRRHGSLRFGIGGCQVEVSDDGRVAVVVVDDRVAIPPETRP